MSLCQRLTLDYSPLRSTPKALRKQAMRPTYSTNARSSPRISDWKSLCVKSRTSDASAVCKKGKAARTVAAENLILGF